MYASSLALRHTAPDWPRLTVRGVLDRLKAADARLRSRMDLVRLDDPLLRDMGVSRADVAVELRHGSIW